MKVLMVADVEFPIDARIEKEARALIAAGHSVRLVCLSGKSNWDNYCEIKISRLPFGETKFKPPLNWIVDYTLYWSVGLFYTYWHALWAKAVHVHNPPDFIVPFLLPLKLLGKTIILDVHDPTHVLAASRMHGKKYEVLVAGLKEWLRLALLSADHVITISPFVADIIRDLSGKDAIIVQNSPDDEFYMDNRPPAPKRVAIYTGAMVGGRGLEVLMKAMETVDGKLIMVGEGDALEHLKSIAPSNVEFIPKASYSEMPRWLSKASIGVIPFEPTPINTIGSPNKLYEFMAMGMPTVCTDLPGPRAIAEGSAVFVEYSPESFSRGINLLFNATEMSKTLGSNARKMAEEFRWSKASIPLIELYARIDANEKEKKDWKSY